MACGDHQEYWQYLANGQFFDAVNCPYADTLGTELWALLVFGALMLALYVNGNGDVSRPLVIAIVGGGIVLSQIPSQAVQLAVVVALITIGGLGFLVTMRLRGRRF